MAGHEGAPATVSLDSLDVGQLEQWRRQLGMEVDHLNTSWKKLDNVRNKLEECRDIIDNTLIAAKHGVETLVPLTSSLYIKGTLDTKDERVLVDIGTGYFCEKSREDAIDYYKRKIQYLDTNIEKIKKIQSEKESAFKAIGLYLSNKLQQGNKEQEKQTPSSALSA